MYFDPDFLLPKILGLLLMAAWLYRSFRELYLFKHGETVTGKVIDIIDNPDVSDNENKIAIIEFYYNGKKIVIEHSFAGATTDFKKEITVYINKRYLKGSAIKPDSGVDILSKFIVPVIFSILILVSFFRVKGC